MRYLTSMREKRPIPFAHKFPNADPLALQLLPRLLVFNPKDRPTAEEALADPYFRGIAKIDREPASQPIPPAEFEFEFEFEFERQKKANKRGVTGSGIPGKTGLSSATFNGDVSFSFLIGQNSICTVKGMVLSSLFSRLTPKTYQSIPIVNLHCQMTC
ncbi:hypothetical protein NL676_017302 [Syzygium grande]|nr:hypothetical protein NL676_017302 [Syzygium grande]